MHTKTQLNSDDVLTSCSNGLSAAQLAAVEDAVALRKASGVPYVPKGFAAVETGAGGDCLFSSLSYIYNALGIDTGAQPHTHAHVRRAIVDHLWQCLLQGRNPGGDMPLAALPMLDEAYIAAIAEPGAWGGQQEVVAAAERWKVRISVYQRHNPRPIQVEGPEAAQHHIALLYFEGGHYQALVPTTAPATVRSPPLPPPSVSPPAQEAPSVPLRTRGLRSAKRPLGDSEGRSINAQLREIEDTASKSV
jgi:hypothetical protein